MRTVARIVLVVIGLFGFALAVIAVCAIVYGYWDYSDAEMGHEASGFMDMFWLVFVFGSVIAFLAYRVFRRTGIGSRSIPETRE